jgi:tetratricopeptide (TPR) repeat protein
MQEWYRSRALYDGVMKLLKAHRFDEALELVEKIPDNKVKSMALNQIVIELAKTGEDYSKVLKKAVETAMEITGKDKSTKALMGLAFELLELGKIEDALKIAEYISDVSNRAKVEAEIALKLAERGEVARAMEIIENILDEDVKTWATSRLASKL